MILTDLYLDSKDMLSDTIFKNLELRTTKEQLKEISQVYSDSRKLLHEEYSEIIELVANDKLKVVRSEYRPKPDSGENPVFVDVEKYKKLESLRKDKNDWDKNWSKYNTMYDPYSQNGIDICSDISNAKLLFGDCAKAKLQDNTNPWEFVIEVQGYEYGIGTRALRKIFVFSPTCEDKQGFFAEIFKPYILRSFSNTCAELRITTELEKYADESINLGLAILSAKNT
jgi:hypothetical protein